VSRVRFAVPVKGLRIVGWGAGLTALIGGAAVALLMGHMPLHAGSPAASMLYGATFAPVGNDRPGLVVTSLRSEVDDAGLRSAADRDRAAAVRPPLHVGDTILAVDDRPATSFSLLREEASRAGDAPVRLRVARDHGLITITLLRSGSGGMRGQQDFADRR
jgi:S1-C subfamily serine protease